MLDHEPVEGPGGAAARRDHDRQAPAEEAPTLSKQDPSEDEKAILSDMESRLATLEAENRAKDRLIRLREDADLVVSLCAQGKSVPAMKDRELAFLQTLSAEQRKAWVELKEVSPSYVHLGGRKSLPDMHRPGTDSKTDVDNQVAELTAMAREKGLART